MTEDTRDLLPAKERRVADDGVEAGHGSIGEDFGKNQRPVEWSPRFLALGKSGLHCRDVPVERCCVPGVVGPHVGLEPDEDSITSPR